ncbi:MAG: hypothetical protein JXA68_00315 [Ignavibacteriales bacterium]|nr:hypothetical protein [Ignavibacteriales bacterium]
MLTDSQIKRIQNEIEKQNVTFSHLKEDILDHLCCEIENEITKGTDFDSAFNNTFKAIGDNGIKKIENETIFLIDYKIFVRRKSIFQFATIGLVLFVLGVFIQLVDLRISKFFQFSGILVLLGFIPLFFINNLLQRSEKPVLFNIYGLFSSLLTIGAILFAIQNWPYKELIFLFSVFALLILFIPTYAWSIYKYQWNKIIHFSFLYFVFLFVSLQFSSYLYKKNNTANAFIHLENNTEAYVEYYNSEIRKINDLSFFSNNNYQNVREQSDKLYNNLEELKKGITTKKTGFWNIDMYNPNEYENNFNNLAIQFSKYRDYCIAQIADNKLKVLINQSFTTEFPDTEIWIRSNFFQTQTTVINNITRLQRDIKFTEYQLLKELMN